MSDLKSQMIEMSDGVLSTPIAQKAITSIPIAAGSAAYFDMIQGWLAIVSVLVGIVTGMLFWVYSIRRNSIAKTNDQILKAELRLKELQIKKLEAEQNGK